MTVLVQWEVRILSNLIVGCDWKLSIQEVYHVYEESYDSLQTSWLSSEIFASKFLASDGNLWKFQTTLRNVFHFWELNYH